MPVQYVPETSTAPSVVISSYRVSLVRAGVGVLREVLIALVVLLSLFLVWQLWWTDVRADASQSQQASSLQEEWDSLTPVRDLLVPVLGDPSPVPVPAAGEAFALLHVQRFGEASRPVLEGTGQDVLKEGVRHYPGTVLPGGVGNLAVAGHQVMYGRPFNQVEELLDGDAVVVETKEVLLTYRVVSREVVRLSDVDVVSPVPGLPGVVPTESMLTLTTCHLVLSVWERFVVHALGSVATLFGWVVVVGGS